MSLEYWERQDLRKREEVRLRMAARVLGIDPRRFERGNRYLHLDHDALLSEIHRVAPLRAPCKSCGNTGPRVATSEWDDLSLCDGCRSLAEKQAAALNVDFLRTRGYYNREKVGDYQPDGLGCVEKVSSVERAWLNGASPYV